jgi:hypothetical protein
LNKHPIEAVWNSLTVADVPWNDRPDVDLTKWLDRRSVIGPVKQPRAFRSGQKPIDTPTADSAVCEIDLLNICGPKIDILEEEATTARDRNGRG